MNLHYIYRAIEFGCDKREEVRHAQRVSPDLSKLGQWQEHGDATYQGVKITCHGVLFAQLFAMQRPCLCTKTHLAAGVKYGLVRACPFPVKQADTLELEVSFRDLRPRASELEGAKSQLVLLWPDGTLKNAFCRLL